VGEAEEGGGNGRSSDVGEAGEQEGFGGERARQMPLATTTKPQGWARASLSPGESDFQGPSLGSSTAVQCRST
jgi:hypothetical protein